MQIIPVIDLKQGAVVRGMGGQRDTYRPIISSLVSGSSPSDIAAAFADHFNAATVYVADIDAIEQGEADIASWRAISGQGLELWIDAGVGSPHQARFVRETLQRASIRGSIVIGLESLPSTGFLPELRDAAGDDAIFSLDLREGIPLCRSEHDRSLSPSDWANLAVEAGFSRMIVLDLADVGSGRGTQTLDLCQLLRKQQPTLKLIAGGGVRHVDDLRHLAAAGCSAALVASALHDGRLTRADCDAIASL